MTTTNQQGRFTAPLPTGTIRLSRGSNTNDNQPKQLELPSFAALWDMIDTDRGATKGQQYICGPMAKGLNTSQPDKFRGEAHWRQAHLAVNSQFLRFDCDVIPKNMLDPLISVVDEYAGCSYTTSSHTPEKPRARLIIALSRPAPRVESIRLGKAFERYLVSRGIMGVEFDSSVYRPEQQCYLPLEGAHFIVHEGTVALNIDELLASEFSKLEDCQGKGSTGIESAQTGFNTLSVDTQRDLCEKIKAGLQAHKELGKAKGYDSTEAQNLADELSTLGAGLNWCWSFTQKSLESVIAELTKDDVSGLNRVQWASRVMLAARLAPVGSDDAEVIRNAVQEWSQKHKVYEGYIAEGNNAPEHEAHGGKGDPFKDFDDRWSEGEHGVRADNSPLKKLWFLANKRLPVPQVLLADGSLFDLFEVQTFDVGSLFGNDKPRVQNCVAVTSKEAKADVYNGQMYASLARGKLTFVPELNHWKRWNGNVWQRCVHGEEMSFAKSVGMLMVNKAAELLATNLEQGEKAMKRAIQSQGVSKLEAMLKLSKSEPSMSVSANKFDADLMLLGVRNGVVNLRTGSLLAADPSMLITKNCNAAFDREAQCPSWLKFLSDIFPDDTDTIETVQRALGYTLTGLNTEEKLFICVGYGSNGKSVFGNVVYRIMGDYATAASGSVLVRRPQGDTGPRDDLAVLAGCRYVGINETQSGDRLDEQVVKMMAGREPITARFMYGSNFTYVPQFTAWLRTNHRPIIVGTDEGIWRRPVIITFGRHFSDDEKDPHLEQKLVAEQDGILAWMIEGCRKYLHAGGLRLSPTIKKASADYREESDILGEFLQTETKSDPNGKVEAGLVWRRYMGWCTEGGYRYGTKRTLSRRLTERGYQTVRSNGKDYYSGFRLTPEPVCSAFSASLGVFR